MRNALGFGLLLTVAVAAANPAYAAAYLKFDGVDGEAASAAAADREVRPDAPRPAGLLLPAVQKVREAASRPRGRVEYEWKVEEGVR